MYQPNKKLLKKYADVLIKFALNDGKGVNEGEVVRVVIPESAKPLYGELQRAILESGAHPMMRYLPNGFNRQFYELANKDQLEFFPKEFVKSRIDLINHTVAIIAEDNPHELEGIDPKKIFMATKKTKLIRDWQFEKEQIGEYTSTIGLYGTPAKAKDAGLTLEQYWDQIEKACFLNEDDPIQKWKSILNKQEEIKKWLNDLQINSVRIKSKNIDLVLKIGEERQWLGGGGRNIPSFEIFTSPDWRGTEGKISLNKPLYRYGVKIEGISLEFSEGKVVKAIAKRNENMLKEMLSQKNADKIGEFSLTDSRMSNITEYMAETLFDENVGGQYGNTHVAVGMAYKEAYSGDSTKLKESDWNNLGFNNSQIHADVISTEDRVVTATLENSEEVVIYRGGKFTL
ncbi:aminopeptidase [Patescibacteria group bacterium]